MTPPAWPDGVADACGVVAFATGSEAQSSTRSSCRLTLQVESFESSSSATVMLFELAWYPRWARIICVNSVAMSTLDCSSALPMSEPRPPVPAVPVLGMPDASLSPKRLLPSLTSPCGC